MAVAVSLTGCSSNVRTPYVPGSAPAMFHPIAAAGTEFDYLAHGYPSEAVEVFEGDAGDYLTWSLQMPSSGSGRRRIALRSRPATMRARPPAPSRW